MRTYCLPMPASPAMRTLARLRASTLFGSVQRSAVPLASSTVRYYQSAADGTYLGAAQMPGTIACCQCGYS